MSVNRTMLVSTKIKYKGKHEHFRVFLLFSPCVSSHHMHSNILFCCFFLWKFIFILSPVPLFIAWWGVCAYVLVCECVYVHFIHIVCKSGSWNSALSFLLESSFLYVRILLVFIIFTTIFIKTNAPETEINRLNLISFFIIDLWHGLFPIHLCIRFYSWERKCRRPNQHHHYYPYIMLCRCYLCCSIVGWLQLDVFPD